MIFTGALINAAAIAAAGVAGSYGSRLMPERMKQTVLSCTALITIGIAVPGLMGSNNQLIPILSLIFGSIIGELLNIEGAVNRLGDFLQRRLGGKGRFTEGFVTGSLVFAVGAMAVMGALDSGLKGDHSILFSKSVIDAASALVFAGTMGIGVSFSALTVLLVEGCMAALASLLAPLLSTAVMAEITFTGSLLIIGISLNLLGLTKLRILNMVPSLLLPILLCQLL